MEVRAIVGVCYCEAHVVGIGYKCYMAFLKLDHLHSHPMLLTFVGLLVSAPQYDASSIAHVYCALDALMLSHAMRIQESSSVSMQVSLLRSYQLESACTLRSALLVCGVDDRCGRSHGAELHASADTAMEDSMVLACYSCTESQLAHVAEAVHRQVWDHTLSHHSGSCSSSERVCELATIHQINVQYVRNVTGGNVSLLVRVLYSVVRHHIPVTSTPSVVATRFLPSCVAMPGVTYWRLVFLATVASVAATRSASLDYDLARNVRISTAALEAPNMPANMTHRLAIVEQQIDSIICSELNSVGL
jgi:hypothetical protein